mmetsp:Transcript_11028/g.12602  ORF Transcript_11028/g.12602 Transcript_11028/m.12602 type:complete len:131 (+) Transcript_11028:285-677(+)
MAFGFEFDRETNLAKGDDRRAKFMLDPAMSQMYFYSPWMEHTYVYIEYHVALLVDCLSLIFVIFLAFWAGAAKGGLRLFNRGIQDLFFPFIKLFLQPFLFAITELRRAFTMGGIVSSEADSEGTEATDMV